MPTYSGRGLSLGEGLGSHGLALARCQRLDDHLAPGRQVDPSLVDLERPEHGYAHNSSVTLSPCANGRGRLLGDDAESPTRWARKHHASHTRGCPGSNPRCRSTRGRPISRRAPLPAAGGRTEPMGGTLDWRLEAAVHASLAWYGDIFRGPRHPDSFRRRPVACA